MERESKVPAQLGVLETVLLFVGVVLLLLLGARFALGFVKFGHKHRNSEAKSNLKSLFTAQRAYFQEKDRYGRGVHEIGFAPERGNRYAYFLQASGSIDLRDFAEETRHDDAVIIWSDRFRFQNALAPTGFAGTGCPVTLGKDAEGHPRGVGIWGTAPQQDFIAVAAGNLDDDSTLDCWSIASMDRVDAHGEPIPAGQPYHEQDDGARLTRWTRIRKAVLGPLAPDLD